MDLNFKWAEKQSKGRTPVEDGAMLRLSINKNGIQKGEIRKAFTVVFYEDMVSKMRFIAGDLVEIGFDKTTRLLAIKRTKSNNGYKLSKMGKTLRVQISDTLYPFIHETLYIEKQHFFEQDGMLVINLNTFTVRMKS